MKAPLLSGMAAVVMCLGSWISASAQEPALANLSVRARVEAGVPFVSAFTVAPGPEKTVMVRVVGPGLSYFGVSGALADPKVELFNSDGVKLAESDNFGPDDAAVAASVGAFPLVAGGKDAVLVKALPAGSYTVHATGVGGIEGTVLVELYDVSGGGNRLTSLSSQAQIGSATDVIISGFILAPGHGTRRILFRALGGSLRMLHPINNAKVDPRIEIFSGTKKIGENDNWSTPQPADPDGFLALSGVFARSGASPLDVAGWDAALVLDLAPGSYTMLARAPRNHSGSVFVEAYEVPPDPNPGGARPPSALKISDFKVLYDNEAYFSGYYPRFTLDETTGHTAVTVVSVVLRPEGTPSFGPPPAWSTWIPVAPGGSVPVESPRFGQSFYFETGPMLATSITAIITYRLSDDSERTFFASCPIPR